MITPALLRAAVGCTAELADIYADHLADACELNDINTPVRLAAFLAQVGHESGGFKHTSEIWGPTDAQKTYEGRKSLGNTQIGDGYYFRGRGLIQVTGRANYTAMSEWLGLDLLRDPDLLTQPRWAALSAATWWAKNGCNQIADSGDFDALTKRINGGLNGIEDRRRRWERAKAAIDTSPEPVEKQPENVHIPPRPDQEPYTTEASMPIHAIVTALLPTLIESIPKLASIFKPGSQVAERNVAAASAVLGIVQSATGAVNAQEAVERIKADPAALADATKAVEAHWFELAESGGGGIEGARKADAVVSGGDMLHSPSFWVALALLPLVYLIVGSVVGLFGSPWSDDVRSAIANGVVGMVIGALAGYYFGQTTSRNRTPAV